MDGRYEDCLRLRAQAVGCIERFLQKRGFNVETEFSERTAKLYYRPGDSKARNLTIVGYWDQGFYVWVVWKGEGGEREECMLASATRHHDGRNFRSLITCSRSFKASARDL
jgi:hypothetical protein